jgi:hypothetical protein
VRAFGLCVPHKPTQNPRGSVPHNHTSRHKNIPQQNISAEYKNKERKQHTHTYKLCGTCLFELFDSK